jgi:hypothetical protein
MFEDNERVGIEEIEVEEMSFDNNQEGLIEFGMSL